MATDIVISFDTTGSMYSCLQAVRNNIQKAVNEFFDGLPDLRVGIIAHGDYCDAPHTISSLDLSNDRDKIVNFVRSIPATHGGDHPECYELVINEAREFFSWRNDANKIFIMIGDAYPHEADNYQNVRHLDWKHEVERLANEKVVIYSIQALADIRGCKEADFWQQLAVMSNGYHFSLEQFGSIVNMIFAVYYKQVGEDALDRFKSEIKARYGTYEYDRMFDVLARGPGSFTDVSTRRSYDYSTRSYKTVKKEYASTGSISIDKMDECLETIPGGRFQTLNVERDSVIADFVRDHGLTFKAGRGFYEFTKTETIQAKKEIVIVDKKTGDMFTGDAVRKILGLPNDGNVRVRPGTLNEWKVFVQSTSHNRKLVGGTTFLYEADIK